MHRILLALALVGCGSGGAVVTPPEPPGPCEQRVSIPTAPKNKVDMLFVLDDGPTMGPKLAAWRASLPAMLKSFDDLAAQGEPAEYHLGVVTADLGSGSTTNPALGCHPGGDQAKLRASADMSGGVNFIDWDQVAGTSNVPDVATTLAAIGDVGTSGCAFRHPLEAAYRALHDNVQENVGFLRPAAILVVVLVTDADDCSAPSATDLFDGSSAGVAKYGPLDRFRCTQFGIACNGAPVPAMSVSGLTGCTPQTMADGGALFDVDRYIDFFTRPAAQGGVKVDPNDAILVGITGPADPVGVTITSPCADDASVASCPTLNHSCVAIDDPSRFGDPAVRLRAVVSAARNNRSGSICDADDSAALTSLFPLIVSALGPGCLQAAVATRTDGTPDCIAENIMSHPDGSQTTVELPSCAEDGNVTPCWRLVDRLADYDSEGCAAPPGPSPSTCKLPLSCQPVVNSASGMRELNSVTVDWGGSPPDAYTTSVVSCATAC